MQQRTVLVFYIIDMLYLFHFLLKDLLSVAPGMSTGMAFESKDRKTATQEIKDAANIINLADILSHDFDDLDLGPDEDEDEDDKNDKVIAMLKLLLVAQT